jgi:hypothetical protein
MRLAERAPAVGRAGGVEGYGADVSVSREGTRRQFHARARVRAGGAYHPSGGLVPEGAVVLAGFASAWGIGVELMTGPAYPSLLTLASMQPFGSQGALLREQSTSLALGGPLGPVDVAARRQSTSMSDGNTRVGFQGYARLPAGRPLALLVAGNTLSFARGSRLYWSPERYVAHAAGVEYAARKRRGFSVAARVLPGLASMTVRDTTGRRIHSDALQLFGGVESSFQTQRWEIGAGISYGQGRAGAYERFDALLRARYLP